MAEAVDLDMLRARLGFKGSDKDPVLAQHLDTAIAWVKARVYDDPPDYWRTQPECVEAVMLQASRLHARDRSPEGVAGWGDLGVVRVMSRDSDIEAMLERHIDMAKAGTA